MPIQPHTEFTLEGITYSCLVDGASKGNDAQSGPWRTVDFLCDYADSDDLMDAMMGIAPYASVTPGAFSPIGPLQYPLNPKLVVQNVRCEGIGGAQPDPKILTYDLARLTAMFRVPSWSSINADGSTVLNVFGNDATFAEVPWLSCTTRGGYAEYPADRRQLAFQASGDPVTQSKNVRIPVLHKTVRRGYVPYLYDDFLDGLTGKVNSVPIFNKPVGTVRFNTYESEPVVMPDGTAANHYTFAFEWRRYDWNKMLVPGTLYTWDFVEDTLSALEYAYADIGSAITFGQS